MISWPDNESAHVHIRRGRAAVSSDLITSLQDIINSGRADTGRIQFIISCLQKGRPLYKSDQQYIEKLLATPAKRIKTPESMWTTQQKIVQEEKKKVEIAELKTKVSTLNVKLEEIARKAAEPPPPKPVYGYSSARTARYLAIFYVGVVLAAIGTLLYKSIIFSTLQITEPENFTQYTIQVSIGIIIIYTVLAHSKVIEELVSKLIDDIKTVTSKLATVREGQEKFLKNRQRFAIKRLLSDLVMIRDHVEKVNDLVIGLNSDPQDEAMLRREIDEHQDQKMRLINQLESILSLSYDVVKTDIVSEALHICSLAKENTLEHPANEQWSHRMNVSAIMHGIDDLIKKLAKL